MKKFIALFYLIICFSSKNFAQTTIVWDGGGTTNNFSEAANWLGDVLPQAGENVQFDNTSTKNCNFDGSASIDIVDLIITSGYSGTINGLSSTPIINGSFSQAGGTFISTNDLTSGMIVGHNMTLTGGTFTHNSGMINLAVDAGTSTISGGFVFNYVLVSSNGTSGAQRNVDFGTCTTSTLELAGGSRIYGYQGSVSITSQLIISGSNTGSPSPNSGTFVFNGAGPISITGASAASRNMLSNIVFNTSGTISMSGHVNVQGNWTGTQGTLTVGSSTENFYGTSAAISGTAAAFDNLTIQSGAVVSMPSNAEVKVGGALTNSGTLNFQTTTALGLNAPGSTSQSLAGGFTLAGIKAYGTGSSRSINITGSMINILDSLKVGDHITFNTGGLITLKSSNSLTARVAEKPSTSSISGNVTVETFIPGGTTGWANFGVRGISAQTFANWDTYVSSGATNGIPMSCTGCVYSPTVIGTGSNSFVSVQGWDENANNYTELTASDPLTPGIGFWVYVGDGPSTTSGLTLINTGSLVQNNVNTSLSTSGPNPHYNLVSNPYACPISWSKVMADGSNALSVSDVIYVYNADLSATTSYVSATNTSSHGSGGITDVIPGGQGFYIEALSAGFGNLYIDETMKTFSVTGNTSANPLLRESGTSKPIQRFRLKIAGLNDWDETAFVTYPEATNGFDIKFDAHKFFQSPGYSGYPGAYSKYTTISSKDVLNEDYSINTLAPLTTSLNIPVLVKVSATGSYTISAKDFENFNTCVGLIDKLDNSYHDLKMSPYSFTISDTTSTPRFEMVLCRDPYVDMVSVPELQNSGSILINQDQQGAYVKTVFSQSTKAVISAYNILGQKLMDDQTVEGTVTNTRLNLDVHNQVVIIKVTTDRETSTKKLVAH